MRVKLIGGLICLVLIAGLSIILGPGLLPGPSRVDAGAKAEKSDSHSVHAVPVVTASAETADFPVQRQSIGFLASPVVVDISARISSEITQIAVKDGQTVKAGDLLFKLDDRALQADLAKDQAALARDQASLVSANADLQRAKEMFDKGAGTQQAYDDQLATTNALQATVQADQAAIQYDQVQLAYTLIKAPVSGRLGAINVAVGDVAGSGSSNGSTESAALVTITQMDPLQVDFTLPENDLPLLQQAMQPPQPDAIVLSLPDNSAVLAKGTLDFIDSSVDQTTGTIAARATVANPDGTLWPGQYVNVVANFGTLKNTVSIPTVAVQNGQNGTYVFVVGSDNKVSIRPVTIALVSNDRSAVGSGLQAGEKVVVEGQSNLKDGATAVEDKGATSAAPEQTQ